MNVKSELFKLMPKLFIGNKKYLYSDNSYYKYVLEEYKNKYFYLNIIEDLKRKKPLVTNSLIGYPDTPDKSLIKHKFGSPERKIDQENVLPGVDSFFYRYVIAGHKTKLIFSFFKKELFFHSYRFSYAQKYEQEEIIDILNNKYVPDKHFDDREFYIVDNHKTVITITEHMGFTVNYFYTGKEVYDQFLQLIQKNKTGTENRDKMKNKILYNKL